MTKHVWVGFALAVWLIGATFLGLFVSALPNHVVAGGVFGPGGDMSAGPTNPANAVGTVYYSINQPAFPLLVGADSFTPASGTEPALFAKDVGASWNWTDGNNLMVVTETVRGVNGWAGVNYTGSIAAILRAGATVQGVGNATLEALPTLAATPGATTVAVSWARTADTNVVSYNLYRTPGPVVPIATVNQAPAPTYTDTGLVPGQYCYSLQVNYPRNLAGGTYGTTGRSESRCATVTGLRPAVQTTDPASGDTGVPLGKVIVVTFSLPMDTVSVVVAIAPNVANTSAWSNGDQTLMVTPTAPLTLATAYRVTITGMDKAGNPLVAGPVPNPWTFTTNRLPTAVLNKPGVGLRVTGGSPLEIQWTMSDPETPTANLRVWLNYTVGAVINPIPAVQGQTGLASVNWYNWTTAALNTDITITLEVMDAAGGKDADTSPTVTIDSTPPTVSMTTPAVDATSVATDTPVVLTFSEAMAGASVEGGAVTFSPAVTGLTYSWATGNAVLTVGHAVFAPNTRYTVTVSTAAKDSSTPGNALRGAYSANFTTGGGTKAPKAPTNLRSTSATQTSVALAWNAPTQYTDNSSLPAAEIASYDVYRALSATGTPTKIGSSTTTTYTDSTAAAGTQYYYWVKTKDTAGRESDFSASVTVTTPSPVGGGIDPLLIAILLIVIVLVVVGLVLLMRRKKPGAPEEVPPPQEEAPTQPEGEAPAEEPTPSEEGGETGGETGGEPGGEGGNPPA